MTRLSLRSAVRPAAVAGLVLTAALTGCTAEPESEAAPLPADSALDPCPDQPDRPAEGADTLPPLAFDCLGGGTLDLARAPGVPSVVNLWGSWCAPCRKELPLLQQVADEADDRLQVLGVVSKDGVPQATSFAADAAVTFPSAYDRDGELMAELGLNALPYTYFLDEQGAVVHTEIGPVDSADELRALVTEHLGVRW